MAKPIYTHLIIDCQPIEGFQTYVYKIQRKSDGAFYIGSRCRSVFDIGSKYFTSATSTVTNVQKDFKANPDAWYVSICRTFVDKRTAVAWENKLIKSAVDSGQNILNLHYVLLNGDRMWSTAGMSMPNGAKASSAVIRGTKWVNNGEISIRCHPKEIPAGFVLGRLPYWTDEMRDEHIKRFSGKNNPFFGKKHTEHTIKKCNVKKGTLWFTDGINEINCKPGTEPKGWHTGRTKNTCKKISKGKTGKVWITDGIQSKCVVKETPLPVGWWYGQSEQHKKNNSISNKGRRTITNGKEKTIIMSMEPIPEGWNYTKRSQK